MTRRIRTLKGRVLVKHQPPPSITEGGIIIPLGEQERPQLGELVAKSAGSDLQVGSLVMFPKFSDKRIQLEGETYELTHEDHLLLEIQPTKTRS